MPQQQDVSESTINPSREEVWSANFEEVKAFYEKNKHLTLPSIRLRNWLTYQRNNAKTLRKDQLDRLDSIRYKDISFHNQSNEDAWAEKYQQLKEEIQKRQGPAELPIRDKKLASWLTRQKRLAEDKKMHPAKREKLEMLGIDLSVKSNFRNRERYNKKNQERWHHRYEEFRAYCNTHGVEKITTRHPTLGSFVVSQRRQYKEMMKEGKEMDPERVKLLGFKWTSQKTSG